MLIGPRTEYYIYDLCDSFATGCPAHRSLGRVRAAHSISDVCDSSCGLARPPIAHIVHTFIYNKYNRLAAAINGMNEKTHNRPANAQARTIVHLCASASGGGFFGYLINTLGLTINKLPNKTSSYNLRRRAQDPRWRGVESKRYMQSVAT